MSTAVVINLHARRGAPRLERTVRRFLPDAKLALTRSLAECHTFLDGLQDTELILSGGGDGTAVSLLNALDRQVGPEGIIPTLGILPLGTGNGWARATGAPSFERGLPRLSRHRGPWPTQTFDLVEVEGMLSPWAGTGWDAEILSDYQTMMRKLPRRSADWIGGFPGYMVSLFGHTIPRMAFRSGTNVRVVNTGSDALVIDAAGRPVPLEDGGKGAVLYEGPMSVCGCGTTRDLGLGFRAFPFAGMMRGRMAARVYGEKTLRAASKTRQLWRGEHPLPNDAHWLLDGCRMEFDRDVPFEIGGDVVGSRSSVDFKLARQIATLLDWTRLAA